MNEIITWTKMKMRPLTEQELAELVEKFGEEPAKECCDCELPEDGEEVLIKTHTGYVTTDIFCNDGDAGVYFESLDIENVKAWAHMPKGPEDEDEWAK